MVTWLVAVFVLRFMGTLKVGRGFVLVWLASSVTAIIAWAGLTPMELSMEVATMGGGAVVVSNGLSIAMEPYGRVLASMEVFTGSERVMVAQVSTEGVLTVYFVIGDAVAWLSIVGFVVIVVWTVFRRRRAKQTESSPEEQM